jgi:hypothetical protein
MSWSKAKALGLILAASMTTACFENDDGGDNDAAVEDAGDNVSGEDNTGGNNAENNSTGGNNSGDNEPTNNGGNNSGDNGEDMDAGADNGGESTGGSTGTSTGGSTGTSTGGSTGTSTGGSTGTSTGASSGGSTGASTGGSTGVTIPDFGNAALDAPSRAVLVQTYLVTEDYANNTSWKPFFEASTALRPLFVAAGSHKNQVRVFQNPVAWQASQAWINSGLPAPLDYPNGSVIVKENYVEDTTTVPSTFKLDSKSIMAKIDVLDETATVMSGSSTILAYEGDWFYVKVTNPAAPAAPVPSHSPNCAGCHNGRTQKTLWPIDATNNPTGGKTDSLVPYDYLYLPFCFDADNHAATTGYVGCKAPGQ